MDNAALASRVKNIIAASLPVVFVFGSLTIKGSRSDLSMNPKFADFGLADNYRFSLRAALADFTAGVPVEGDAITVSGTAYTVLSAAKDPLDMTIQINLGESYG